MNRHFKQGSGCFRCAICRRQTRDTGQDGSHLCEQCWTIAGYDNSVNDNGWSGKAEGQAYVAECNRLLRVIGKRGGDMNAVMMNNSYIWPLATTPA